MLPDIDKKPKKPTMIKMAGYLERKGRMVSNAYNYFVMNVCVCVCHYYIINYLLLFLSLLLLSYNTRVIVVYHGPVYTRSNFLKRPTIIYINDNLSIKNISPFDYVLDNVKGVGAG